MLEKIVELTNLYIENMPKKERKTYGQFFTSIETARFMTSLYDIPTNKVRITVWMRVLALEFCHVLLLNGWSSLIQ